VAFGGAGALHAYAIAQSVGIEKVLVPRFAGVACAFGATTMDIRHDLEVTHFAHAAEVDVAALNAAYADLEAKVVGLLEQDGVAADALTLERTALMRYVGQTYDIPTPVPAGELTAEAVADVARSFNGVHQREYGVSSEDFDVAFVTLRVTGVGATAKPDPEAFREALLSGAQTNGAGSLKERRQAYFDGGHHDIEIHDVTKLSIDQVVRGPAVIEQQDGVIVLPPGAIGRADRYENVLITTDEAIA
jgi:N-methylhydantoinase A